MRLSPEDIRGLLPLLYIKLAMAGASTRIHNRTRPESEHSQHQQIGRKGKAEGGRGGLIYAFYVPAFTLPVQRAWIWFYLPPPLPRLMWPWSEGTTHRSDPLRIRFGPRSVRYAAALLCVSDWNPVQQGRAGGGHLTTTKMAVGGGQRKDEGVPFL